MDPFSILLLVECEDGDACPIRCTMVHLGPRILRVVIDPGVEIREVENEEAAGVQVAVKTVQCADHVSGFDQVVERGPHAQDGIEPLGKAEDPHVGRGHVGSGPSMAEVPARDSNHVIGPIAADHAISALHESEIDREGPARHIKHIVD